jgi:RimJ/RimL family protein N-acetyltransferase
MASAPDLDTERLTLRAHRPSDFDDSAAMWADPTVTRHIGGRPFSREESWQRMLRNPGLWAWLGYGFWVVREKASGRFVGEVGFADFKRELAPSIEGCPEGGWVLATWAHGQGFAGEATRATHAWLDAALDVPRSVCIIDTGNAASIRTAGKLGYREVVRTRYKVDEVVLFERRRGNTPAD